MALQLDRNSQVVDREQQIKKKKTTQQQDQEKEIEMNDDAAVVDTSRRRDGLLCTLLSLSLSSPPVFVLRKKFVRSYLSRNQNYLGITHAEYDGGFRQQGGLTTCTTGGLPLRALDRHGVRYPMVLVRHPKTCRLRKGWGGFLRKSGVLQDDDTNVDDVVEIWAFRSPAWPTGLGLVLLHYTKEEDARITRPPSLLLQHLEEDSYNDGGTSSSVDETNCSPLDKQEEEEVEVVRAAAILMSMTK